MTELEKLKRAKIYMNQLADGFDPISGEQLPEDTILNNVRLSRCFFFVSDILRQVIENDGNAIRKTYKKAVLPPFTLSNDLRNKIEISSTPTMIKHFTDRINSLIDDSITQKLKPTAFTAWLMKNNFLCEDVVNDKRRKRPTKSGLELGISTEEREGQYGGYLAILYNESAQRYLVRNLDQIISLSSGD